MFSTIFTAYHHHFVPILLFLAHRKGFPSRCACFFEVKKSQSRANSGLLGLTRGISRFMNGDVLRVCELLSEYYGNNERWNISSFLYLSSVGLRLFGFTISLDFWSLRWFG